MRLDELLGLQEMPMRINKELDDDNETPEDAFKVFFLTDKALKERGYTNNLMGKRDNVEVYLADDHETAIVGTRDVRHDGEEGFQVIGQLLFKLSLKLGSKETMRLSREILQVDLVEVAKQTKMAGLGTFLYHSLIDKGYTIISDNKQYRGGEELWKKIARSHASNEVVYLLDHGKFVMDGDKPIEYDGKNVPDDDIWSETDKLKQFMLLVYTKKQ